MAPRGNPDPTKADNFLEQIGDRDIEIDEFKVDNLRKIASRYKIPGSHDMNKETLVAAINKARRDDLPAS